jgi:hypothetical protein
MTTNNENVSQVSESSDAVLPPQTEPAKRKYTKKADQTSGNDAILAVLAKATTPLSKQEVFKALSDANYELVKDNWNSRISTLVKEGLVVQTGNKRGSKYQTV